MFAGAFETLMQLKVHLTCSAHRMRIRYYLSDYGIILFTYAYYEVYEELQVGAALYGEVYPRVSTRPC